MDLTQRKLVDEALAYFEGEEDPASFVALANQILKVGLRDRVLLERVAAFHLKNRDRGGLHQYFADVSARFACRSTKNRDPICGEMRPLWRGNLDSIFFFEDSASKVERLRRLLLGKDCSAAQAVLRELVTREGTPVPLLEAELKVAECMADIATQDRLRARLEELRLFPSDV